MAMIDGEKVQNTIKWLEEVHDIHAWTARGVLNGVDHLPVSESSEDLAKAHNDCIEAVIRAILERHTIAAGERETKPECSCAPIPNETVRVFNPECPVHKGIHDPRPAPSRDAGLRDSGQCAHGKWWAAENCEQCSAEAGDPFLHHEALHMANYFADSVDEHLASHPFVLLHGNLRKKAAEIAKGLADLYQMIGSLSARADTLRGERG